MKRGGGGGVKGRKGNRTFRGVGVAAKRIEIEDKMNTAEVEGEGFMCSC